jgi:hypothetical protein
MMCGENSCCDYEVFWTKRCLRAPTKNTNEERKANERAQVFPRTRGKHGASMACALHIPGVSARLWGTRRNLGGNTAQAWLAHSTFLAFPRTRGEDAILECASRACAGVGAHPWTRAA